MRCPACQKDDTKVIDSRTIDEGVAIRRRRECDSCTFRFSTVEEVEILNLQVTKTDGAREPYDKEKLVSGLHKALEKRGFSPERFKRLVGRIERDIQIKSKADEIPTKDIGRLVIKHLKRSDKVAYIRFASVYNSFQDLESFRDELNKLIKKR